MRMQRRKKSQHEASTTAAPIQAQFQSRPFQDANAPPDKQAAPPQMQLQQEQRGFDLANISLFANNNSPSSQPIQRNEEDGDIQMKPEPDAIQRMDDEDKDIQMKPESNGSINPLFKNLVQRDNLQDTAPKIPIQAKLTVGAPGDKYEQEADQVAHNVVQQINSPTADAVQASATVQRETVEEDDKLQTKPTIQRQEIDGGVEASSELESSINQAKGGGQSLDGSLQRSMGQAMGADFSGVKVHTDSQADTLNQSLQAKAFTTGQHVFFKKGEYQPESAGGQELIAHELTHVVQQNGSQVQASSTIQRTVHNEAGESQEKAKVIEYLVANDIDNDIATQLANDYVEAQDPISISDLLKLARQSDEKSLEQAEPETQSVLHAKAMEMIQQNDNWWIEKLSHYNYFLYKDDTGALAYFASVLLDEKTEAECSLALSKNQEKQLLDKTRKDIVFDFTREACQGNPAQTKCDLVAQLLMEQAVGIPAYEEIKELFEETIIKPRKQAGGKKKETPDEVTSDQGGWAKHYLPSDQGFQQDIITWAKEEGQAVMQVKFNGDGAHTFVLERLAPSQILMYQAYEGALSLKQFMTTEDNPLGQGKPLNLETLTTKLIAPLQSGLTGAGISGRAYDEAFGTTHKNPDKKSITVSEIAIVAFAIPSQSEAGGTAQKGFINIMGTLHDD